MFFSFFLHSIFELTTNTHTSCFIEFKRYFFIRNSLLLVENICTREVEILFQFLIISMHLLYNTKFVRSERKNEWLKTMRKVTFEIIVNAIQEWEKYFLMTHYNKSKHSHQFTIIIMIKNYPHVIPCEYITSWILKLITIYPDRRFKKLFIS